MSLASIFHFTHFRAGIRMKTDSQIASLGQETPVASLPAALREIWASNEAMTKASLINFAIYSERAGSLEENSALMQEVAGEHACRAILIAAEPYDEEARVRAWITAHCHTGGAGGNSICSEQIALRLTGRVRDALRNLLFAHLESDLPLVFFWQGDFTGRWEPHLFRRINRLIIDSTTWSNPASQLEKLRSAWRDTNSHFVVLDLAWIRIFPFRQALAGVFDIALAKENLCKLNAISITHAPGHRVSAALLASWIAYRAGWSLDADERAFIEEEGAPLARLVLHGSGPCRIEISREPGSAFLTSRILGVPHEASQVSPAVADDLASLVSERLNRGGNTQLYFKLWRQAAAWL